MLTEHTAELAARQSTLINELARQEQVYKSDIASLHSDLATLQGKQRRNVKLGG